MSVTKAEVATAKRLTEADKAWMAAVIDLKGTVIRKHNKMRKTPQLVLYVGTKDARIAERLSSLTGTAPEAHEQKQLGEFLRRGCVEHCKDAHVHTHKPMPFVTRWSVTGVAAATVLANLAPYMSTYPDYAGVVAEILVNFAAKGQGSSATRAAVLRLEALGWRIPMGISRRMA